MTGNLNVMRARNMTQNTVKVGDRVRATGIVGRNGAAAILADSMVKVDDGTVLWGNPQVQPVAEGYGEDND